METPVEVLWVFVDFHKLLPEFSASNQVLINTSQLFFQQAYEEIRKPVFDLLEELIPKKSRKKLGRNGMSMWEIFVLSCIKLSCNTDFDHLKDIADNHNTARKMLGLSPAIDAGTPDITGLMTTPFDLFGAARITGGIIDIGAYERPDDCPPIPTISQWGMMILFLLILIFGISWILQFNTRSLKGIK